MPDASNSDPEAEPQSALVTNISGGVNVAANQVTIGGDVVGRDKIVGYTGEQVSALLTQIGSTFQPKPFNDHCPYLGLDAFTEDDAVRFFGRETLVNELFICTVERRRAATRANYLQWFDQNWRGTQDTRRTATFDELVPANRDAAQIKSMVQKLADARLIATDEQDYR